MADLNKGTKIISGGTKLFKEALRRLDDKVFDIFVREALTKLETTKTGKIADTKRNREAIAAFGQAMKKAFELSGLNGELKDFVANFDELALQAQDVQKEVNSIKVAQSLISPIKDLFVQQVVFDMQGQGLASNLVRPIQQQLYRAITVGTNLIEVQRSLEQSFIGDTQTTGLLERYGTQISRDALGQFEGTLNQAIKNEYELNAIRYVGSLVEDSRPQCVRWVRARVLNDNELEEEIDWAFRNGSGMIPGTTPDNFLANRGGYNCRHVAIPTRK